MRHHARALPASRSPVCGARLAADARRRLAIAIVCLGVLAFARTSRAHPDAGARSVDAGAPSIDAGRAPADAPSADAAAPTVASLRDQLAKLTAKRDALQSLLAGNLPDGLYTTELFAIDLHDEPTVERRRRELASGLGEPSSRAPGDAGVAAMPSDGGVAAIDDAGRATDELGTLRSEIATRATEVDRLRLAFLKLPRDRRTAVLAAEDVARRNAVDQAAAADDLARAQQEQRRAEDAQRAALAQADQAREEIQRLIATERARIEGARASLAEQRADLSRLRAKQSAAITDRHALAFSLTEASHTVAPGKDADALYDRVVTEVEAARDWLSASLDALDAIEPPTPFELSPALADSNEPVVVRARDELAKNVGDIDALGARLTADRTAAGWQLARADANDAKDLNKVRIELLDKLSSDKRDRTLGFGEEGRDQLRRELEHLTLLARWTWRSELPALAAAVSSLSDWNVLLSFLVRVLGIGLLVGFARWSIGHGRRGLARLPDIIVRGLNRPIVARAALLAVGVLSLLWTPLIVVLLIWVCGQVGAPGLTNPLFGVPYGLVLAYATYRLIVVATFGAIRRLQGKGMVWTAEFSERVLRSVNFVGRIAFAAYILGEISEAILGRGYLYHLVIRAAVVAALPLALILFSRWRADIVDAYVKRRPNGVLARLVQRSRDRWYGFFLALAAFALVVLQWLGNGARRFALSFDQTRKALAYLFRRRLERRGGDLGANAVQVLPPEVAAALAPDTAPADGVLAPWFPGLDAFRADVMTWTGERDRIGSWIVVGKSGMGKSTWLHGAVIAAGLPATRVELATRIVEPAQLLARIAQALALVSAEEATIVAALRDGPRRLIVIDDLQRLALRGVGQLAVWGLLRRIIERTNDRVYWLGACSYYADEFLGWVDRGPAPFCGRTQLARWSEPQIQALLEARLSTTGWRPNYEDVMTVQIDPSQRAIAIANTAREYARLIWDYAEGAPRAALHCWAHSLVPGDARELRVRLFARPPETQLEALDEVSRHVLAALIWHEQLSIDHAATALRFPRSQCDLAFRQLNAAGVIVHSAHGEFAIAIAWWPAVTRYLTRKHLIET